MDLERLELRDEIRKEVRFFARRVLSELEPAILASYDDALNSGREFTVDVKRRVRAAVKSL